MPNSDRCLVSSLPTSRECFITWTKPIQNPDKSITVQFWAFAKEPGAATNVKTPTYKFTASVEGGVIDGHNELATAGGTTGPITVSDEPGQYDGRDVVVLKLTQVSFEASKAKLVLLATLEYNHYDRDGAIVDSDSASTSATLNIVKYTGQMEMDQYEPDEPEPGE